MREETEGLPETDRTVAMGPLSERGVRGKGGRRAGATGAERGARSEGQGLVPGVRGCRGEGACVRQAPRAVGQA
uniref:Uncharacterized protein n=1 Tax=Streptomyces avermitilis TaxID=33903 RepID=A0A499V7M1_STRAX|nr:hypothetical protein SAVMC3_14790 [Streptomyces avermitilis]